MNENVFERIATFAKITNFVNTHKECLARSPKSGNFVDPSLNEEYKELRQSLFQEMRNWFIYLGKDNVPDSPLKDKIDRFSPDFDRGDLLLKQAEVDRVIMHKFKKQENTYVHFVEADSTTRYYLYKDNYPFYEFRMSVWAFFLKASNRLHQLVTSGLFEATISSVIILNCILLGFQDQTSDNTKVSFPNLLEILFFILYLIEMTVKIIALGFLFNRGAYLRDPWNMLDFLIVISSIVSLVQAYSDPTVPNSSNINFSSLRTFRILRPLRTINAVKKLRTLVETILSSIPYLLDIFMIILLSMVIFSVAAMQLFPGDLLQQCFPAKTGRISQNYDMNLACGGAKSCQPGWICGKIYKNPVSGIYSFDSFPEAYLAVFVIISTESWSTLNQYLIYASSGWSVLYCTSIIFIESWFLHNLLLAIISAKFNEAQQEKSTQDIEYRNGSKDKIYNRYFEPKLIRGHAITSVDGVPMQKMLLYNPQRYKQRSIIQSLRCGHNPSGIFDYLLRPFYLLREELDQELTLGLAYHMKRIQQADYLDTNDDTFFTHRREEFHNIRKRMGISSANSTSNTNEAEKVVQKSSHGTVDSGFELICDVADLNPDKGEYAPQLKLLFDAFEAHNIPRPNPSIKDIQLEHLSSSRKEENSSSHMMSRINIISAKLNRNSIEHNKNPIQILPVLREDLSEKRFGAENLSQEDQEGPAAKSVELAHIKLGITNIKGGLRQDSVFLDNLRSKHSSRQYSNIRELRFDQIFNYIQEEGSPPLMSNNMEPPSLSRINLEKINLQEGKLFEDRFSKDWLDYTYWENITEYNYQSYNHFAGLKNKVKLKPARRKKPGKEIMDMADFDDQESAYRDHLETLPVKHINRDACLRYKYDPETCFNSMIDVMNPKKPNNPVQVISHQQAAGFRRQNYAPRAYEPRDSLYQPGEFVANRKPKHVLHFENESELSRGQQRRLYRQKWYEQSKIMQRKPFFPLKNRNDTLAMMERADFQAGNYDRKLHAKQKLREQSVQQMRTDSLANQDLSLPLSSEGMRLSSLKVNQIEVSESNILGVSSQFLNDFVELDTKHILEADDTDEHGVAKLKRILTEKIMENHELYASLHERDAESDEINHLNWSAEQVYHHKDYRKGKTDKVISSLNNQDLLIWLQGWDGCFQTIRKKMESFVFSKPFDRFITFCILLNTVILTLDGLISEETSKIFDKINTGVTFVFLLETAIKLAAIGFKRFFSNFTFVFELGVTTISAIELSFALQLSPGPNQANTLSGFRALRILRMFRVLRVARILQGLKFMKVIVAVIVESAEQYAYVGLIMLLFIFIYALLGMQFYAGNLKYQGQPPRMNFDSLLWSFAALFQLLTIENWTDILQTLYSSSVNKAVSLVFILSWIIIGNYIFFNLFLALLLGGFESDQVVKQLEENQDEYKEIEEVIIRKKEILKLRQADAEEKAHRSNQSLQLLIKGGIFDLTNDDDMVLDALDEVELKNRAHYFISRRCVDDASSEDDLLIKALVEKVGQREEEEEISENRIYARVQCKISLNLMTKSNPIRFLSAKISSHPWFESAVFVLIIISSLKLVVETYLDDEGTKFQNDILSWIDFTITWLFGLEAILKIIRNGLFWDPGSYLRDPWCGLDFFIVVTSFIDMALTNVNLPIVKIFRTLRPLRFVRRYENMRVIISSLVGVLGPLFSVVLVILLVWLIFAILAINFIGGKLFSCDTTNYYGVTKSDCLALGGNWNRSYWNFDNVIESFVTLFVLTSLEGWPNVMGISLDASDYEGGPPIYNNYKWMLLYYLIFILVSSLFLLDLFTGVIFYQYGLEVEKESSANSKNCTAEQIKWIMIQKLIHSAEPEYDIHKTPSNRVRKLCFNLVMSTIFESIMMFAIIINIIILCLYYEGMSKKYQNNLELLNLIISWIFVGEFILKVVAFSWTYFRDNWNTFDFVIVILGLVDFTLDLTKLNNNAFGWAPQVAKGFRVLRVLRITKLLKNEQLSGIKKLIKTLTFSLPSILNVFALLIMTYFIFAVVACFLFRNVKLTNTANNNLVWNFQNFHSSLFLLFRCSTGEDWPTVMFNYGDSAGLYTASRVFFIIFTIITTFVILNLVDLVVVQIFENFYFDPDNALELFEKVKQEFNPAWNTFTHKSRGKSIHYLQLLRFFAHLE